VQQTLVIGAHGFIGQNLVRRLQSTGVQVELALSTTPVDTFVGRSFDAVFFCAGNSRTYLAERDPLTSLQQDVFALHDYLRRLTYGTWVQVSSSAVYPPTSQSKIESAALGLQDVSVYGAHKLLAERYVTQVAERWVIVRPTGFFGPGAKKNLLYDIRHGRRDIYVRRGSWLDYLSIETFSDVLRTLAERAHNEIVNVGSGHALPLEQILAMRPIDYVFHDERLVDDRGLSMVRLRRYYPETRRAEIEAAIRNWVHGSSDDLSVRSAPMSTDSRNHAG
jgi:nucleoside-diphosphate-sugar epimerase